MMANNAVVNKLYEIRKAQGAINRANEFLAVEGMEPVYYDWHRATVTNNEAAIERIKAAPETDWN